MQSNKELKLEAKKRAKRKKKEEVQRLWLVGSSKWKDKRAIKKVLAQFDYKTVDFVLLGTSLGLETLALSICKQLKFNVILLPPNYTRNDINAVYFRNHLMFSQLKPTHVFGFYDNLPDPHDDKIDVQAKSTNQLLSLARSKKIEHQLITTKKAK